MRPGYTAEVPSHTYRALAPCTPYLVLYVYKSIAAPHRMRVYVCSGIDPTSVSVDGGGSCAALPPSHRANRGLKRWCPDTRTQPHTRPPHKPPFSHYHPCSILVPPLPLSANTVRNQPTGTLAQLRVHAVRAGPRQPEALQELVRQVPESVAARNHSLGA